MVRTQSFPHGNLKTTKNQQPAQKNIKTNQQSRPAKNSVWRTQTSRNCDCYTLSAVFQRPMAHEKKNKIGTQMKSPDTQNYKIKRKTTSTRKTLKTQPPTNSLVVAFRLQNGNTFSPPKSKTIPEIIKMDARGRLEPPKWATGTAESCQNKQNSRFSPPSLDNPLRSARFLHSCF